MNEKIDLNKYSENSYQWTKNQHYVPQFYLKQFTNEQGLIEAVNKERKTFGTYNIKHICSGKYFYGVETGKKDKVSQLLEDFFNKVENNFANIYEYVVENILNYNTKISEDLIFKLSEFVAVSYLRGIGFKKNFKKTSEDMYKQFMIHDYKLKKYYTPNNPIIKNISKNKKIEEMLLNGKFDIVENNMGYYKYMFENLENYINWFYNKKKIFYISNGERNFITTDYCVSEITPETKGIFGVGFFDQIHYFPLSPKILVVYYPPSKKGKDNKRKQTTKRETVYHNFLCGMCGSYIYAKSQNDFLEDEYSKVRSMYADELYKLFPTTFKKDKEFKDEIENFTREKGISFRPFFNQVCDSLLGGNQ